MVHSLAKSVCASFSFPLFHRLDRVCVFWSLMKRHCSQGRSFVNRSRRRDGHRLSTYGYHHVHRQKWHHEVWFSLLSLWLLAPSFLAKLRLLGFLPLMLQGLLPLSFLPPGRTQHRCHRCHLHL